MTIKKLIAGNWKMNGLAADGRERAQALADLGNNPAFDMVLCPPATLIQQTLWLLKDSGVAVGGQDCHVKEHGAFTGDVSAAMLKDLGCAYVILGHSERRQHHKETSLEVAAKTLAAHAAGLTAIVCVGETLEQREAGHAQDVVEKQLAESLPPGATAANTVIAYEPVWAIGTGKVASNEDIKTMHAHIRTLAGGMRILYGGSVKADGAREILHIENVNGVLVGGASLKADEFRAIALASA
jgi:triosephosphate isomerase (TIM)